MTEQQSEVTVPCPWCGQGKTLADCHADIRVSCPCNICGRFYKIDFRTMRVYRISRKPRRAIKKR